ncbi:MAG: hypothetical protein RL131_573 [Bacteroidota bacterium]
MIRYLYNEMSPEENKSFISFVESSPAIKEQFQMIKEGFDVLNSISFSPSKRSVDRIRQYGSIDGLSMQ